MARIRSEDTMPELAVRKLLHRAGYRFRLHRNDLPGKPDIVLPRYRIAIFVHGCFWHGHEGCREGRKPKSNLAYWNRKLERNKERDRRNIQQLETQGWHPVVVWECELQHGDALVRRLGAEIKASDGNG